MALLENVFANSRRSLVLRVVFSPHLLLFARICPRQPWEGEASADATAFFAFLSSREQEKRKKKGKKEKKQRLSISSSGKLRNRCPITHYGRLISPEARSRDTRIISVFGSRSLRLRNGCPREFWCISEFATARGDSFRIRARMKRSKMRPAAGEEEEEKNWSVLFKLIGRLAALDKETPMESSSTNRSGTLSRSSLLNEFPSKLTCRLLSRSQLPRTAVVCRSLHTHTHAHSCDSFEFPGHGLAAWHPCETFWVTYALHLPQ